MEGQLRALSQEPGDFTDDAVLGLRGLAATGVEPLLLGYHPIARLNPYHSLLYQRSREEGIAPVHLVRLDTLPELTELTRVGFTTALHLHWLNLVLGDARTAREARKDLDDWLGRIDAYRDAGGHLVWTVHNILPHAARFEDEEARLSQEVVDRADVVHIMASATPEIVAPYFRIPPEKVLHVPHPSYLGAYEDRIGKLAARHELGIMPGEIVHVVLGAIRPYKGLTELLDAWDVVAADDVPRRLVIAGGPSDEPGIAEVLERAAIHPRILLHAGQVAPADVQVYLRAADVAVLPYVRALNSGALLLALTFGLPAVVPAGGGLAELLDGAASRMFSHDDPAGLVAALRAADELATPEASAAARAIAERYAPGPLATRFARGLREKLGLPLVDEEPEAALVG
jgi:glycosyltransferase involved in cell wall biosynthesis